MRKLFIISILITFPFSMIGQAKIKLPGVYSQMIKYYPSSKDKISFSNQYPITDLQNTKIDSTNTHQFLLNLPIVNDSLLSECIRYAMLSLSFDPAYKNLSRGTEIWYGPISNKLNVDPTMTGIYFKNNVDSINMYILTTYSLQIMEKKKKTNTSKYIGESIKFILEKRLLKK